LVPLLLIPLALGCAEHRPGKTEDSTAAVPAASGYDAGTLLAERREKDRALAGSDSPIPAGARTTFQGLSYYPPDPALAVEAELIPTVPPAPVKIAATKGDIRDMLRYGRFRFTIAGKTLELAVFKYDSTTPVLFVPFRDATNGGETYEVGRYIDLEEKPGALRYLLDFNRAYNPYCAYNDGYTCPIVPAENTLPVPIHAGEKLPAGLIHEKAGGGRP
jgi:uncharacterized protein (DUF1684 family)